MAINFSLSDKRVEDPMESWEGRPWHGWVPGADLQDVWANNRGIWRFGNRVEKERIATFSRLGKIVLVAEITGIAVPPAHVKVTSNYKGAELKIVTISNASPAAPTALRPTLSQCRLRCTLNP